MKKSNIRTLRNAIILIAILGAYFMLGIYLADYVGGILLSAWVVLTVVILISSALYFTGVWKLIKEKIGGK